MISACLSSLHVLDIQKPLAPCASVTRELHGVLWLLLLLLSLLLMLLLAPPRLSLANSPSRYTSPSKPEEPTSCGDKTFCSLCSPPSPAPSTTCDCAALSASCTQVTTCTRTIPNLIWYDIPNATRIALGAADMWGTLPAYLGSRPCGMYQVPSVHVYGRHHVKSRRSSGLPMLVSGWRGPVLLEYALTCCSDCSHEVDLRNRWHT